MSRETDRRGYSVRYQEGWAVLVVPPPETGNRAPYVDDVQSRLKLLGIPPVPSKRIREILESATGRPEKLVDWSAGASLGARIAVSVSDDGMQATVNVTAPRPGGAPITASALRRALQESGIRSGVDDEGLADFEEQPIYGMETVIAQGEPPVHGRAARSECLFVTDRGKPWKELAYGRIDLRELNFIQYRREGDLLVKPIPETAAVDGFDVYGNVLEAEPPGLEETIRPGPGVAESPEGLVAAMDGNVLLEDRVVSMEPVVTVKEVDYGTGNIEFDGSVIVEESIADGFTVRASGDLQIGKTVGRVNLEAGRNLILRAGTVGDGEGNLVVGGDLFAKFIETARIDVGGDLVVSEAILHSNIAVGGNLYLSGGRSELTGGKTIVRGSLVCRKIGGLYDTRTIVFVGIKPRDFDRFLEIDGELRTCREEIDELDRREAYLAKKEGMDEERSQLKRTKAIREAEARQISEALKKARAGLAPRPESLVAVEDRIHGGTVISFGLEEYLLSEKGLTKVILKKEGDQIVAHGYRVGQDLDIAAVNDAPPDDPTESPQR